MAALRRFRSSSYHQLWLHATTTQSQWGARSSVMKTQLLTPLLIKQSMPRGVIRKPARHRYVASGKGFLRQHNQAGSRRPPHLGGEGSTASSVTPAAHDRHIDTSEPER